MLLCVIVLLCYVVLLCDIVLLLCHCCVKVVSGGSAPTAALAQPTAVPIHDCDVQGFRIIGFVVVYDVSGLRMACAVNIVIYYDDISIRSCTIAGSLFHGFDVAPCAVPAASPCAYGS